MSRKLLRAALAVVLAGKEPPSEIELMPAGQVRVRPHDGREDWQNPDAAGVVAATEALGLPRPIDFEHQGDRSRENGQPAPAAGWIKRVFERAGAVWAEVDWTERAAAMIAAQEYRFLSPVFAYDKSRTVKFIAGAGLTNDPALFIRALARAEPNQEDPEMDLKKLREALGLAADATEATILAAAAAAQKALGDLAKALGVEDGADAAAIATAAVAKVTAGKEAVDGLKTVAEAAGLAGDAKVDDVKSAVATAKARADAKPEGDPDPNAFVPRAQYDALAKRVDTLETGTAEASATAAVDEAVKAGKVAPATRDWALGYAKSDPAGFKAFVENAPVVVKPGEIGSLPKAGGKPADAPLTEEELAVCKATGISEDAYKKSRQQLTEAGRVGG